jgi:hypothetical protein
LPCIEVAYCYLIEGKVFTDWTLNKYYRMAYQIIATVMSKMRFQLGTKEGFVEVDEGEVGGKRKNGVGRYIPRRKKMVILLIDRKDKTFIAIFSGIGMYISD